MCHVSVSLFKPYVVNFQVLHDIAKLDPGANGARAVWVAASENPYVNVKCSGSRKEVAGSVLNSPASSGAGVRGTAASPTSNGDEAAIRGRIYYNCPIQ